MSKNIFKKTAQLTQEKHVSQILDAKQSFSYNASLNKSFWIQTKIQLIKSLIKKRRFLIKRLPGFRIWEDVMRKDNKTLQMEYCYVQRPTL